MAGILSKGIKLKYGTGTSTQTFVEITGLQEVPDLGGAAEKVDVTTLADGNYKYINGIKDYGDLTFLFLYDNSGASSNYRICRGLEEAQEDDPTAITNFQLEFPDGTKFAFSGQVSTTIVGQGVNAATQFNLNITLNSDITVTDPT